MEFLERFEFEEQEDEDTTYLCTIKIRHYLIECWESDYGQCFYIIYKDLNTGEIEEMGLGAYNTELFETIVNSFDMKGYHYSVGEEEYWQRLLTRCQERGLEDKDYADYGKYDFAEMYKQLEEFRNERRKQN